MTFEDLEMFYRDYKNGIITLDQWDAIFRLGAKDVVKEHEKLLKEDE